MKTFSVQNVIWESYSPCARQFSYFKLIYFALPLPKLIYSKNRKPLTTKKQRELEISIWNINKQNIRALAQRERQYAKDILQSPFDL